MSTLTLLHQAKKPADRLGRRIVFLIVLSGALLSVLSASAQLFLSYQRDREEVLQSIDVIEESFREGFENALWEFNFDLVQTLMDGIYNKADVHFIALETTTGQKWSQGEASSTDLIMDKLDFQYRQEAGTAVPLGTMTIGFSLVNVQERVWAQFWTLLFSNFAKTALASIIMLAIFNHFVSRHLRSIATYVAGSSWLNRSEALKLERSGDDRQDDLDYIVTAINDAKARSAQAYKAVQAEVNQRRLAERSLARKAENLVRLNELLVQTNREQAEFTYAISHDLRSPTNTVGMLLDELTLSHGGVFDDDAKHLIDRAQRTVGRMGKLVEDVLSYSRTIEEEFAPEAVDLNFLAQEILEDLQSDIASTNATIDLGELPVVTGNSLQLRLLFQNLISNAIKFRSEDRSPRITIHAESDRKAGKRSIVISDNGIGIAPEFHDRIFGLFQRLHSYEAFPGSGLGLTLCKRIVANHGGAIELRSVPGEGTAFEFPLPLYMP
ncbi:sensor histidine kinase [Algihabitans albus]|uniref:sensor histidine kinase n=1 Tax=Algihabitans albus TaxID=2164067 RepID=UPI000E5CEFC7|nr:ATP-binding protein [Algihabitans albus]